MTPLTEFFLGSAFFRVFTHPTDVHCCNIESRARIQITQHEWDGPQGASGRHIAPKLKLSQPFKRIFTKVSFGELRKAACRGSYLGIQRLTDGSSLYHVSHWRCNCFLWFFSRGKGSVSACCLCFSSTLGDHVTRWSLGTTPEALLGSSALSYCVTGEL